MKRSATLFLSVAAAAAMLAVNTGCTKLMARDQLNRGVRAFKISKFPEAVDHFKQATDLDPTFSVARLYLATAYYSQYIPGADSPENKEMADNAFREYNRVLESDPNNNLALSSIASLYFHQKKWEDAEKWNQRLVTSNPRSKEGFYTLGVIAWTKSFSKRMEARAKLGMKPEDPGPIKDKKVREPLAAELLPIINAGIANLEKAIAVDPEYDDAMAYVNLMHRERADFQDDKTAYDKDVATAEAWVQKTMETKKIKTERLQKAQAGGIVQDSK
jgi:tetratricopeptide (TPR) repeat protein